MAEEELLEAASQDTPYVSILILTHNAPDYVRKTLDSVTRLTLGVAYEIVVVDNASSRETIELLEAYKEDGLIQHLHLSPTNTLFAKGNNIAAGFSSKKATHFLLLNSDVEVHSGDWLTRILAVHRSGITALQVHECPKRVDGWCLLIDAFLYLKHKLDENHEWWWSVTKLQADLLAANFTVQGVVSYRHLMTHFGGKSGMGFKNAKGMDVSIEDVNAWFGGRTITEVQA